MPPSDWSGGSLFCYLLVIQSTVCSETNHSIMSTISSDLSCPNSGNNKIAEVRCLMDDGLPRYATGDYFNLTADLSTCISSKFLDVFRFLQFSLDKTKIKSSDAPLVIKKVAETSSVGQQIAWDFILNHWKLLEKRLVIPCF